MVMMVGRERLVQLYSGIILDAKVEATLCGLGSQRWDGGLLWLMVGCGMQIR